MAAELRREWSNLVGLPVELHRHGRYIRSGLVDAAMPDSSVLWLAAEGADGRQMFEAALGYQARINPRELEGSFRFMMAKTHTPKNETATKFGSSLTSYNYSRNEAQPCRTGQVTVGYGSAQATLAEQSITR